jgi:hypothetical protein
MFFPRFASYPTILGSFLLAAAACSSSNNGGAGAASTSSSATTTSTAGSGGTPGTASSTGTGGGDCSGLFSMPGLCATCTEQKCCAELTACKGSSDCFACVTGAKDVKTDPACQAAPVKALLGAIDTCDEMKCTDECLDPSMDTPACDASLTQTGACATDTTKFPCNPITNAGCPGGQQCDYAIGAGSSNVFQCFPLDAMPTALCADCSTHYCGAGLTCIGTCARYCCDDSDCGTGVCSKTAAEVDQPGQGAVGLCVTKT